MTPPFDLRSDRPVRAELPAALARAAAAGLTGLGVVTAPLDDPDWLDAYVARVRAADALSPARVTAAVALPLPLPRLTIHSRLSHVDGVLLVPDPGDGPEAVIAAAVAADLPVPVTLAGLTELPPGGAAALAAAGIAVEVTERWRTPSLGVAVALAAAGVQLVAGSAARTAADVARWGHVRAIAAALAPVPHPA